MNSKNWSYLMILLAIVWLFLGYWWFVCRACGVGTTAPPPAGTDGQITAVPPNGPLMFNWSDAAPVAGAGFPAFRDSLLAGYDGEDVLSITGYYMPGEENTSKFSDMGLARAFAIKSMLADYMDTSKVEIRSEMVETIPGSRENPFMSAGFRFLERNGRVEETLEAATIYFPYKSAVRTVDPEITAYLNKLAGQFKGTNRTLTITGHTDDVGSEAYNYDLGMERSRAIRDSLVAKGLSPDQIKIVSRGEENPAVGNSSENGRSQNRRVIITLN